MLLPFYKQSLRQTWTYEGGTKGKDGRQGNKRYCRVPSCGEGGEERTGSEGEHATRMERSGCERGVIGFPPSHGHRIGIPGISSDITGKAVPKQGGVEEGDTKESR